MNKLKYNQKKEDEIEEDTEDYGNYGE